MPTNKPLKHKNPRVSALRAQGNPKKKFKVQKAVELAAAIEDAMLARGWNRSEFAKAMGVQPNQITRWLSGTQGINTDSLFEMEYELGVTLVLNQQPEQTDDRIVHKPSIFEMAIIPALNSVSIHKKSPVLGVVQKMRVENTPIVTNVRIDVNPHGSWVYYNCGLGFKKNNHFYHPISQAN
ncbi:MAG: helix-turn-helix transcriptional regulator [Bacteroidota bacterium]|jgi:transcriptional regulator with XRE-family HTH domain